MSEALALHELILDGDGTPCDYRFLEMNPAFERMTGLGRDCIVGRRVTEVLPGIDATLIETYAQVVLTGEPLRFERYEEHLGRWYDVFAFRTDEREFAVLFVDISDRKRNEEVLAFLAQSVQSGGGEHFFRELASFLARSLGAQFVCIDRLEGDGLTAQTLAVWSDGVFEDNVSYALTDTPCGEVVGKNACCFPASVCQFFPRDQVLKDLRAESYVGVTLWRHDGTPIGLIAVIWRKPLPDPRVATTVMERVAVRAGNELERLEAERDLRASEAHFRQMVHSLPIPTALANDRGEIVLLNDEFTRALGYELADVPTVDAWHRRAYPDSAYRSWVDQTWSKAVHEATEKGGAVPPTEFRVTRKDGTVLTMLLSALPRPDSLLVCLVDVSRERALQIQLALASRLAAMGTLVAGVAHEINNPLAGQLANQGLAMEVVQDVKDRLLGSTPLDRQAEGRLLEDVLDALKDAETGGRRIARIVKDLTAFGRPDPRHTRVRLMDVVDESLRWLHASVVQTSTIRVDDQSAPDVIASAGQIEQVLVNLVTNAARATPEGQQREIVVQLGPGTPGMARLEVIDQGTGMDPALMDRIFDPFFTTRQVGQGTGLGLSISHAIVTAHGGTLTVESEVGKGSTFRVELPVTPGEA